MEYTSSELALLANTTPSRSLKDDWDETCDRMYNKEVTLLQVETHRLINDLIENRECYQKQAARKWKHCTEEQVISGVDLMIQKRIEELKAEEQQNIWGLQETLHYRKQLIT